MAVWWLTYVTHASARWSRKAGIGAVHEDKRCHNQRISLKDVVLLS
jgi:hypothetical protein